MNVLIFDVLSFAVGFFFALMVSMAVNESRGSRVESGTVVYPTEQQCSIETQRLCRFTSVGVYTPIKDI